MLPAADPSLTPFFDPRGVLVIGASTNPAKLGYGIAQNLVNSGYQGAIHFVNPRGGRLFERPIYTEPEQVPDPVDLAVILVPPDAVPATLEACGARGIRGAIIASGGFRETGPEGAALEEICLTTARRYNMRLMGPNCIGLLDTHLPLDTTFLPPPGPPTGDIAFISHSGAICAAIIDWARGQGFGFSRLVSLGNQLDVTETDVLAPVATDVHTRVVTLYLEAISDGRRFVELARQVSRHKPLLALKVGRTAAGRQAAASHTGALAGQEVAFDAALRRAGVLRAETAEQLFDWARALAWCPTANATMRVAVLTNAGGPGVMAADAVEANGLSLAVFSEATTGRLRELLPPAASVANPVDMLASASPQQYAAGLRLLLDDEGVDGVIVILPPPPMYTAGSVARQLIPLIQTAVKPVVVALMGHGLVQEGLAFLRAVHIPTYTFPETAASALGALARHAAYLSTEQAQPREPAGLDAAQARQILLDAPDAADGWLSRETLLAVLDAYGITTPWSSVARSAEEAAAAARVMGFPVAMKIVSSAIPHKTDVGGVMLNLADEAAVTAAFQELLTRTKTSKPEAQISSVEVQQMAGEGQEVIAGVTRDPQFGPLLMFGSGGVEVEGLQDVAFALAPLTANEARQLLQETWAGRKLQGYRNIPPADETAVIDVLLRLGHLANDFPQLAEIEINPLIVSGQGAVAVDARARLFGYNATDIA